MIYYWIKIIIQYIIYYSDLLRGGFLLIKDTFFFLNYEYYKFIWTISITCNIILYNIEYFSTIINKKNKNKFDISKTVIY